jgi:anti-sigma factor RsiW
MTEIMTCQSKDLLVAYLYDDCAPEERRAVEAHLAECPDCQAEVTGLSEVRASLSAWEAPPLPAHVRVVMEGAEAPTRTWRRWWVAAPLAAAAVLVLAAAAGLANLEVQYGSQGLVVRTGWSRPAAPAQASPAAVVPAAAGTPWRADLTTLEERLRREIATARPAPPEATVALTSSRTTDAELLRRVQQIVDDSEVRQQRNLALRMAEVSRDFSLQRQADLVQIQQGLGRLEGRTEAEAAKQRELMNYIMRVSQPQQPK